MKIYKGTKIIGLLATIVIFACLLCGFTYSGIQIEGGDNNGTCGGVEVPIIMYHNISKSGHGKFIISPKEFKSDLDFLKTNGYNTVFMSELIAYVYEGAALPQNPIVLTFDDGNFGVYKYAYPLLKEYNMKAVMAIIGRYTDKYSSDGRTDINYPNLTWTQVNEMKQSGTSEFQNHSYDLHFGVGACKAATESEDAYMQRLRNDLERMQRKTFEMTGEMPTTFAYPFGKLSEKSEIVIKTAGFKASLTCFEGINTIKLGDASCLYKLKRYNRPHGKALSQIIEEFNKLKS